MAHAQHINRFIFDYKQNPILIKQAVSNLCPEGFALWREGAAGWKVAQAFDGLQSVKIPKRGFFGRVLCDPMSRLLQIFISGGLNDDVVAHFLLASVGIFRIFRKSAKTSSTGLPLPAFISAIARKVLASSMDSTIFW